MNRLMYEWMDGWMNGRMAPRMEHLGSCVNTNLLIYLDVITLPEKVENLPEVLLPCRMKASRISSAEFSTIAGVGPKSTNTRCLLSSD